MSNENSHIKNVLYTESDIADINKRLSRQIESVYAKAKNLVLVGVLKGSVVFLADLMRSLSVPAEIDFIRVSSYGDSTTSSGNVTILMDLNRPNLPNEDILIIEDIVDSGRTLKYLVSYLLAKGAKSVKTAVFLDKPSRREVEFSADFSGVTIENIFVVGYGLDYKQKYRSLPYIGVLKDEYKN